MTLDQVNSLERAEFVAELGWIFEHSPWVAEQAWDKRPFVSFEALHEAMSTVMESATREQQLALLCAHPELGSRTAMSTASTNEQAQAFGGDIPFPVEELQRYRNKFGFPFIYALKGSTPADIGLALMIRGADTPEQEFRQALWEVRRIAWFRLKDKFQESGSA